MEPEAPSNLKRRPMVAVIGDASTDSVGAKAVAARQVGALIIERRWRLVTGGMGGVMKEASAGARASAAWVDGDIIGIAPGSDPAAANPFVDVVVATGMDHLRNSIVAHSDAIIVIGGGAGTLSEIALAWIYRRLIVALPYEGWGGKLAGMKIDQRIRYKDIPDDCVYGAGSAAQAVELVARLLPQYQRRHSGIASRPAS
jgi:uncharacterized protein (TIGR00725 family)